MHSLVHSLDGLGCWEDMSDDSAEILFQSPNPQKNLLSSNYKFSKYCKPQD